MRARSSRSSSAAVSDGVEAPERLRVSTGSTRCGVAARDDVVDDDADVVADVRRRSVGVVDELVGAAGSGGAAARPKYVNVSSS